MTALAGRIRLNIRVDSSTRIGAGHFQRCLAIAEEARALGTSVRFLYSQLDALSSQALAESGFESIHLKTASGPEPSLGSVEAIWGRSNQESDANEAVLALSLEKTERVLLDHYGLDDHWVRIVGGLVGFGNVFVVKDDIDRSFSAKAMHLGFASPEVLGKLVSVDQSSELPNYLSTYFPLSQSVRQRSQNNTETLSSLPTTPIRRVFVYLGHSDVRDHIARIVLAIGKLSLSNPVNVSVLSSFYPSEFSSWDRIYEKGSTVTRVSFDNQAEYLDFLMNQDLVIGAGGVSSLERLYLGVPQIVFGVAENQNANATALSQWGVLTWAGDLRQKTVDDIEMEIAPVFDSPELLRRRAHLGRLFIDGFGARRLVQTVANPAICELSIRKVRDSDAGTLFCWGNDPESRRVSIENHPILPDEHLAWFSNLMQSDAKTTSAYIVENNGCPLGHIRFQLQEGTTYKISYGLDSAFRGLGLSAKLISLGIREHNKLVPQASYRAIVHQTNPASLRSLESIRFKRVSTSGEFIELALGPS